MERQQHNFSRKTFAKSGKNEQQLRPSNVFILLYQDHVRDYQEQMVYLMENGYDGGVTTVFGLEDLNAMEENIKLHTRSGLEMAAENWRYRQIFRFSDNIYMDSSDKNIRKRGEQTFAMEKHILDYFVRDGITMISIRGGYVINLARNVANYIEHGQLLAEMPLVSHFNANQRLDPVIQPHPWNQWNEFRTYLHFNKHVQLALEMTNRVPSSEELRRWCGEPIAAIIIPDYLLQKDSTEFLRLDNEHIEVLDQLLRITRRLIVKCANQKAKSRSYAEYLDQLSTRLIEHHVQMKVADVLNRPALPFKMELLNLKAEKYDLYRQALDLAIADLIDEEKLLNGMAPAKLPILIVGGEKIGLVDAVISAVQAAKRLATIYIANTNKEHVQIVKSVLAERPKGHEIIFLTNDLDCITLDLQVSLIVIETIGAFGDNCLLPERLRSAQRFLSSHGVCIPSSCTSFITPIMSSKFFSSAMNFSQVYSLPQAAVRHKKTERYYTINPVNYYEIAPQQQLFHFKFPSEKHFVTDMKTVTFQSKMECMLHGFLGTFEATLYKNIKIGTKVPRSNQQPLYFSAYFPINCPQHLAAASPIQVTFWRCSTALRMWYEWVITTPAMTKVHNIGGSSCFVYCKDED